MKKYNLAKIMKRAWEIKREADRKIENQLWNLMIFREMEEKEKAPFSECLKLAWEEARRSIKLMEKYNVTKAAADAMAEQETYISMQERTEVSVSWNIWRGIRAYFKVSGWSTYRNNKRTNYVAIN